ncbi:hypothetical protein ONE63_008936 [Megalurothrips usitatus]|uniref:Probable Ufm1-specific protease 2 n=1 Tax=Megalurothrips usitatus TaxID=439358 RepID=A0AAV7XM83_9NEOP|nr:hypothetical protein ONE63_008936 [Megalurothrips usitatus]
MPRISKVLVASDVIDRFKDLKDAACGSLLGHFHDDTLAIVGFVISDQENSTCQNSLKCTSTEIRVCGAFTVDADVQKAEACFEMMSKLQNAKCFGSPLLLSNVRDDIQSYVNNVQTTFETVSKSQLASTFVYFRSKAELTIKSERSQQYIQIAFDDLRKKVLSEDVAFYIPSKNVFLSGPTNEKIFGGSGITADSRVKDLYSQSDRGSKDYAVLPSQVHLKMTKDFDQEDIHNTVPYVRQIRRLIGPFQSAKICVTIDVMTLVHRTSSVGSLFSVLKNSLLHGMSKVEANLVSQLASDSLSAPEIYHFLPAQSSFFISTVYAKTHPDVDLRKQREQLHQTFGFPLDQPLFRRSQAYQFPSGSSNSGPLRNPHDGLNSGVKGGQVSLVKGQYNYHHYMQDRFDDNGWGCAYRSLQTIVSWFRLQGYTEKDVPTHKQIQECLVKIGDKPSSFVGSRQWIGSTEVSFVLESMLGVSSKILTASTGEEVGCLGSELHYHFQTHGTPIMIGGGVLAHTIIGVDYNRSTGEIKFLILDPHYTGGEDLGVITGKGWVGWKDVKFWTKNAFYNLCLPLRPVGDI